MNDFLLYLEQGIRHILDPNGLDHFYFIISFCLIYTFKNWRTVIGLVTAFTVGHCLTLILSGFGLITINTHLVELLIPITILISCINNYWQILQPKKEQQKTIATYSILLCFGLIHGLGFSNYIKLMLFDDESIILPLFSFNLGIELGQLLIVFGFLIVIYLLQQLHAKNKYQLLTLNSIIVVLILKIIITNF